MVIQGWRESARYERDGDIFLMRNSLGEMVIIAGWRRRCKVRCGEMELDSG